MASGNERVRRSVAFNPLGSTSPTVQTPNSKSAKLFMTTTCYSISKRIGVQGQSFESKLRLKRLGETRTSMVEFRRKRGPGRTAATVWLRPPTWIRIPSDAYLKQAREIANSQKIAWFPARFWRSTIDRRKTIDASEPAFKPRKVKKSDGKYRDRAAERRVGEGNDYAQVEAVLEDFEKRLGNTSATDEQRKYLGGDSDHSILVKGLDIALLEQNKAKASLSTVDDDSLEQAFMEAASEPTVPKKRTREDIIRELKEKKGIKSSAPANDDALEAAKKQGKFKPIGFKPIGGAENKPKKKKVKTDGVDGERKKKKRKVDAVEQKGETDKADEPAPSSKVTESDPKASSSKLPPPEDDVPDDFDIFADAGEYRGLDLEDEEDEDDGAAARRVENPELKDGEESAPPPKEMKPTPGPVDEEEEGEVEQPPMRLVPLASSALPSIKDLLAMDEAANSSNKWKKKKDKKKGGKGDADDDDAAPKKKMTAEVKAERDYKRLKSYTDKKGGASAE
ncbi:hypothetical protein MVEN_00985300 [Mycena venus]|uniref:RED-like N-terminal domain-containing protein n=1 Tax=Mycena venus TaxID=2733690 RepID=A0A8H7D2N5_9AGAR|nr:hypothetical protein MVEN_00985300 [Mycena venus]